MMMRTTLLLAIACILKGSSAFQPISSSRTIIRLHHLAAHNNKNNPLEDAPSFQPDCVLPTEDAAYHAKDQTLPKPAVVMAIALLGSPTCALASTTDSLTDTTSTLLATAGPIPSALLAWLHFNGIVGVAGGLVTERFLLQPGLSIEDEIKINNADGIYGLSAFSLLISGYFRATDFAKGWDFYRNEPIFWLKMSAVAVLGGLSFFPAIVFFRRDQARQKGETLPPLSDALIERMTRIINAELLALLSIPLLASLMARGVFYVDDFPWAIGVVLYVVSLGGAGYKYGKEAFDMMETEGALIPIETTGTTSDAEQ